MKKVLYIAILIIIAFSLSLNAVQSTINVSIYFPDTQVVTGYEKAGEVKTYPEQKLFDLVNGGGEVYFEFGYENVYTQRYTKGESTINISIFSMSEVKSAFGIYCFFRHPDDTIQDFAGVKEINVQPNGVNFYIGKYFVKIESFDEGEEVIKFIKNIARHIITKITQNEAESVSQKVTVPLPDNGMKVKTLKVLSGNSSANAGGEFYQGNPLNFSKDKTAFFAQYSIEIDNANFIVNMASVKKTGDVKGIIMFDMGKKLFGSKEKALKNAFYVDKLPVVGFLKDNVRYFILEGNESIYIFTDIKEENYMQTLRYIYRNKGIFNVN